MASRYLRRALLPLALAAATLVSGCYVAPYPFYGPGPGYYRPHYYYR